MLAGILPYLPQASRMPWLKNMVRQYNLHYLLLQLHGRVVLFSCLANGVNKHLPITFMESFEHWRYHLMNISQNIFTRNSRHVLLRVVYHELQNFDIYSGSNELCLISLLKCPVGEAASDPIPLGKEKQRCRIIWCTSKGGNVNTCRKES